LVRNPILNHSLTKIWSKIEKMRLLSVDTNSFSNLFLFLEIKSFIILELFCSIVRNKTSNKAFYTLCRSVPVPRKNRMKHCPVFFIFKLLEKKGYLVKRALPGIAEKVEICTGKVP
jgi:hypothetical protein